ncbi:MAG: UDP-glucuronic acid decarboxylase family protein [Acidimicrobiales bacterium]
MRIVVAGGAGFIGSHVCDALVARGDEVVCVDNFLTGRRANIAHLIGNQRFTLVEHDVCEPLGPVVTVPVDRVMALASPASPKDFLELPLEILAVGSTGTRNLLDLARAHGARFFLASTSEVYGDPLVHPQPESYWGNVSSIGPRSCYDEAKRFSEALTMAYHRRYGIEVRIVRIFNTYGPRMRPDDGRVVTNFLVQAIQGDPITVYGDGSRTRSFCYVDDEVRGLLALLDGDYTGPMNIGNDGEFTLSELAVLAKEITGSSSPVVHLELPPERDGDPLQRRPDLTLVRSTLGWSPEIPLREGLARTAAWLRRELIINR